LTFLKSTKLSAENTVLLILKISELLATSLLLKSPMASTSIHMGMLKVRQRTLLLLLDGFVAELLLSKMGTRSARKGSMSVMSFRDAGLLA
jgi:hypothetical protein